MKKLITSALLFSTITVGCKKEETPEPVVQTTPPPVIAPCLGSWRIDTVLTITKYLDVESYRVKQDVSASSMYYVEVFTLDTLIRNYYGGAFHADTIPITFGTNGTYTYNNVTNGLRSFEVVGTNLIQTEINLPINDSTKIYIKHFHKL